MNTLTEELVETNQLSLHRVTASLRQEDAFHSFSIKDLQNAN